MLLRKRRSNKRGEIVETEKGPVKREKMGSTPVKSPHFCCALRTGLPKVQQTGITPTETGKWFTWLSGSAVQRRVNAG